MLQKPRTEIGKHFFFSVKGYVMNSLGFKGSIWSLLHTLLLKKIFVCMFARFYFVLFCFCNNLKMIESFLAHELYKNKSQANSLVVQWFMVGTAAAWVAAVTWIWSLACEFPHATDMARKKKREEKKRKSQAKPNQDMYLKVPSDTVPNCHKLETTHSSSTKEHKHVI